MKEYTRAKINVAGSMTGLIAVIFLLISMFFVLSKSIPVVVALVAVLAPGALSLVVAIQVLIEAYKDLNSRKMIGKDL